jgi:Flp pilus assembly protein TadD
VQAALARARAGQLDEALARVRELFVKHPTEEAVGLALLEVHERAGKPRNAVELLAGAAQVHPRSEALLFALASAQDRSADHAAAFGTMRRLLALDPQHAGALNYVGYALTLRGSREELREAEQLLRRASALRPDDGAIADSLGFCLLRLGQTPAALSELERADQLSPDDPVILSHLGDAYLASGRKEEAAAAFRRALHDLQPRDRATARASSEPPALEPVRVEIPRLEQERYPSHGEVPDRLPDPTDSTVRDELEAKLRSLTAR